MRLTWSASPEAPWCGERTGNAASSKSSCLTATNCGTPRFGRSTPCSTTMSSSIAWRRPWRSATLRVSAGADWARPPPSCCGCSSSSISPTGASMNECEREVRGSLVYRAFCRIDGERVPDAKTLIRLAHLLDEPVLKDVLARLVALGRARRVVRGRRLRVDTTVVETNIHYPTDATLLADGVRVLTRSLRRIGARVRERTRSVARRVFEIAQRSRTAGRRVRPRVRAQSQAKMKVLYQGLMRIT